MVILSLRVTCVSGKSLLLLAQQKQNILVHGLQWSCWIFLDADWLY